MSAQIAGLDHSLVVEMFSDEKGALFLLHRSSLLAPNATLDQAETHTRQLAMEITHELGGLPLALDQVGAYLKATGSSLATYQHIYHQRRFQLLNNRRGVDHPEPAATTWDISFHKVEQQNPAAANLLRFCAFLAPDAIPEAILTEGAEHLGPILAPVAAEAYLLNEAVESLRTYSLITRDPQARVLTIHRLVQAVLRDSMPAETQRHWMQRAVHAVEAAYPGPDFANWPTLECLLPHALVCATWIKQASLATHEAFSLLNQAGYYLHDRARYTEAEPLYQRALAIKEQALGASHPSTALSLNNLAMLYRDQAKYAEAVPLLKRALAIDEQVSGSEHPDTATSLHNLAGLYRDQGKYAEAEPLFRRALAIDEQVLGLEHPVVAKDLVNLAGLYRDQRKCVEAEPLYKRALAIFEQQLGERHPETARSLNNLAMLYTNQGKYAEAEPLYQRALEIREQQLGPQHPDTARSLDNLAGLYDAQGKYAEAEPLYVCALAIREQELGGSHPDTARSLNNLAGLYYAQGKDTEAEPLFQRALAIREQMLVGEHPDTAESLWWLAVVSQRQQRYQEAELLYQRALSVYQRTLGLEHPTTQQVRQGYGSLLRAMGRDEDAGKREEDS